MTERARSVPRKFPGSLESQGSGRQLRDVPVRHAIPLRDASEQGRPGRS